MKISTVFFLVLILIFNSDFILAQDSLNKNNESDRAAGNPDAFVPQTINPNPVIPEVPLDPNALEEVFGADSVIFGPLGARGRGNIFFCNNPRTVVEHRLYLRLTVPTNLWFVIYEGDSLNAVYNLVSSVNMPAQGVGPGWYSSGPISYTLQNGKYYLIYAQWDSAAVYYNDQMVTPYPVQCSFGEQVSGIGWFWSPTYTVPPPATQNQSSEILGTGVSYYQTIVTDVIPNIPANLTATAVSETEIELNWSDNSDNETGFEVQRRAGIVYTTIATVGENVTTFTDTGRTTGIEYCYRVRSVNLVGGSPYTADACATPANLPGVPNLTLPNDGATQVSVTPTLTWEAAANSDSYTLQIGLDNNFNVIFDEFPDTNTTISIPAPLPHNTTFYWRVRGVNSNGSGNWSSVWSFTTLSTMNLSSPPIPFPNRTNPGDYQATEYKIVGLPGNGNINVSTILSGTQGTDWEVYDDNDEDSNYYVKFDASNPFRFVAGKSFWIIRKGNLSINQTVTAAAVNQSGYVEINLPREDFNLITNPFLVNVQWSAVLALNSLPGTTPLRHYNGGWTNSNVMQPFTGYLFDNATDLSTLRIPYPIGGSSLPKQNNSLLWSINIDLTCGELFDKTTSFGVSGEALQGKDILDFRKPRSPGNIPMVYFNRPEWNKGYSFYSTDIRPEFDELQVWEFEVSSKLREKIQLSFTGISEVPDYMEIYLIDEDRTKPVNLRDASLYEFIPVKHISEFRILVGKSENINSLLSNIIPTEFDLGNNFPNPFNPSTTFNVDIPQPARIKLAVYNLLGEEVRVLSEEYVDAGKHWYRWDGKDESGFVAPSGIYFYNLITDKGINLSKKMILMK